MYVLLPCLYVCLYIHAVCDCVSLDVVHVSVCVHMCVYTCVYVCFHVYVCLWVYECAFLCECVHACICVSTCISTCVCMCFSVCVDYNSSGIRNVMSLPKRKCELGWVNRRGKEGESEAVSLELGSDPGTYGSCPLHSSSLTLGTSQRRLEHAGTPWVVTESQLGGY